VRESVVSARRGPISDGWAVRGPWKRRTDHFAPQKTISPNTNSNRVHATMSLAGVLLWVLK
jgi:hypothetical protein